MLARFTWSSSADRGVLARDGYRVVEFSRLVSDAAGRARRAAAPRTSLESLAAPWLRTFDGRQPLAVLGVRLDDLQSLAVLHGDVLEPAWRTATPLLVESEHRLSKLAPERFVDPHF